MHALKAAILGTHRRLTKSPFLTVVVVLTLLTFLIHVPVLPIYVLLEHLWGSGGPAEIAHVPLRERFAVGVLIGPGLETMVFQAAPLTLALRFRWSDERLPLVCVASAGAFALAHAYSVKYVVWAMITGLVLAYAFVVTRPPIWRAVCATWMIHGLHNLPICLLG